MAGICQLALAWTGLEVQSARYRQAHSASCAIMMTWLSANWQYNMCNPWPELGWR
jgi:hypothetical protein